MMNVLSLIFHCFSMLLAFTSVCDVNCQWPRNEMLFSVECRAYKIVEFELLSFKVRIDILDFAKFYPF